MSEKKSSSLRNALRGVRVNEPLRLSKAGPSFRPPESSPKTEEEVPPNGAPLSEEARIEAPQKVEPRNEPPRNELVQSGVPQNQAALKGPTHSEQPQSEDAQSQAAQNEPARSKPPGDEHAQIEVPREKPAKPKVAQTESPSAEMAQIELPQLEQPSKTFFRLSDRAFSYPQLQRLSGDCFRLFLWMSSKGWRYQSSDGTLRASVGYIEDHTAMSHATISRCLKTLREAALIQLLETDYKRGNVWSISPIAFAGCDPENLPPRSEGPQNEGSRKEEAAPSKREPTHLGLRAKVPQNEGQIRSINKYKKLSQEGAQSLVARVEGVRAPEKRRAEMKGLMQLLESYSCDEIKLALTYVETHGTLGNEPCHSPFRYLATAIDDVLALSRNTKISSRLATVQKEEDTDESHYEARRQAAFEKFQQDLNAEERAKFVSDFVAREFSWGYEPSESLAVRLAAMAWLEQKEPAPQAVGAA